MTATQHPADRFVSPDGVYLLSHSVGLPPIDARSRAVSDHFGPWETNPSDAWPAWLETIERFRIALATLLNSTSSSFCPQPNVSSGLTKVLGALPISRAGRRPTVLMTEDAFPSLGYVCQKLGLDVRYIGRAEDTLDARVWASHLDGVDVVLITHVHSNTGQLIPVAEVAALADERTITSIVDVAQSVGVVPIDLESWNADVVIGSCVKWLCGGPGAGWLWAHPDLIDRCEPVDVGWFSHEDPFEFDIHQFRYASDALRFWGGTPSVVAPAIAVHSIELIDEIGVEHIRHHNLELTDRLIEGLAGLVVSPLAHHQRSGTVIVDPASATEAVGVALSDAGIAVDHRPSGFRLSPHVYTSSDDIDATIACVRSAAS